MSDDLWQVPLRDLMLNNAQTRATHYRQQAVELRRMAGDELKERVRADLLDLATKYDALATSVSSK